ncbi:hypothetical protein GBAR_LOCUS25117 [Geodia barretti]|uniref:Death domain-containing protein n=1 Tax=Geodia barretti TaxID=519541 RepID=A0AA35X4T5_GEOBA|nr:hypothetical protein GBAR_LOCUS25117 [Geodia barretti]
MPSFLLEHLTLPPLQSTGNDAGEVGVAAASVGITEGGAASSVCGVLTGTTGSPTEPVNALAVSVTSVLNAEAGSSTSTIYKKYNLTKENLNTKCSDEHILDIGKFISWRKVGRRLKHIEERDIQDIDRDGKDEDDRRRLLLERWHEKNASDATYGEIINAMMKEQKRDEAEKVCELLNSV